MSTAEIRLENVWKHFRRGQLHDSLRDLVPSLARRIMGREPAPGGTRDFWALRDLSFTVSPGEVLGIIGANGAGKSTTLKILNRIMEPTYGAVKVTGKVGALIEVSAGFHQDLTGRQNVFLQGAIMGMRKADVTRRFDEIVEFSGIEEFIDTPVKRYSSGMNARLGFSIAAHLEPDILIIDEVLAVGDHAFQQKAFGRVKAMAQGGLPVVLVSHQLDRIAELCTKCILLERGAVRTEGTAMHCINEYLHGLGGSGPTEASMSGVRFERIMARDGRAAFSGEDLHLQIEGRSELASIPTSWIFAVRAIDTRTGEVVHSVTSPDRGVEFPRNARFRFDVVLQMNVSPGLYKLEVCIWDTAQHQDVLTGPNVQVEVMERLRFFGEVQMNARWSAVVEPLVASSVRVPGAEVLSRHGHPTVGALPVSVPDV